jgi:hypothetical protein
MWSKAGVGIVLVWETTASRAGQGYDAGYRDASIAFPQAKTMGMPDGKPIYFAVDYDADPRAVDPYFKGIYDWARTHFADGQATSRIGVYGGHDVVKYIRDRGYAKYMWQATAWMKGKGWHSEAMQQYGINKTVAGVNVDWNRVTGSDYGVWFSTCIVNPPKPPAREAEDGAAEDAAKKKADEAEKAKRPDQGSPGTSTTTSEGPTSTTGGVTSTTSGAAGSTTYGSGSTTTSAEGGLTFDVGSAARAVAEVPLLRQARALDVPLELLIQAFR